MEVLTGLEAFRQRAGIGDERYQEILVAIYDHQYNWANFMDAYPYGDDTPESEIEPLILEISRTLQRRIMGPMTIEERMIWYETCRRCLLRIMSGSDMVQLAESER